MGKGNPNIVEAGKRTRFPHNDPTKGGRPKGSRNSATVIRRLLELNTKKVNEITGQEETYFDEITAAQLQKAMQGDTQAFNALLDRMEGRATQKTENNNTHHVDIDTWANVFRNKT